MELARACCKALSAKKGQDIVILDVSEQTVVCSYFVIASGKSTTQVRALGDSVDEEIKKQFGLDPIFADKPDGPELLSKLNKNEITYSDIPQFENMIGWLNSAAKNGWFGNDYLKVGWDEISSKLGSGEAVMTFIWARSNFSNFAQRPTTIIWRLKIFRP